MAVERSKYLTIVVMSEGGRAALRLEVPRWFKTALCATALLVAYAVGFAGWQLHGRFGLGGPQLMVEKLDWLRERFCIYEHAAMAKPAPTRREIERKLARERADRLSLGDRPSAVTLLLGVVSPEQRAEAERGRLGDGSLTWPVRDGYFGRGYGSGAGGYHLAIDIAGEPGAEVVAAAPGLVGYAGKELSGYGNVVLIIHPGGRVTLYAHNRKNLVIAGERVAQGQPIAELGSTGRSMGPHLHFELKHAGRNCDPLPLMKQKGAASLTMPAVATVAWPAQAERPEAVRCAPRRMHPQSEQDEGADTDLEEPVALHVNVNPG
jgi:murein DD-endopeptidase MepM/ murein hydrolase activator NlpD